MNHWSDRHAADFRGGGKGTVLVAPDKAISHGVVCLTGGQPWSRLDVDQGRQCEHIHPAYADYNWICLACNQGNERAERIASKHGAAVEVEEKPAKHKPIKFVPKGQKAP